VFASEFFTTRATIYGEAFCGRILRAVVYEHLRLSLRSNNRKANEDEEKYDWINEKQNNCI
jgi:hypothetical protein